MTTRALLQAFVILLPICGALAQEAPVIPPMTRSLAEQPDPAKDIPKALGDWVDWATWDEDDSPAYFNDENRKIPVWVSQLDLSVTETGGTFSLPVTTFRDTWAPLPGDLAAWPLGVSAGGKNLPVMERNKVTVRLLGTRRVADRGNVPLGGNAAVDDASADHRRAPTDPQRSADRQPDLGKQGHALAQAHDQ